MSRVARTRTARLLASALALAAAASAASAATAHTASAPKPATRTVAYLGHRFTVPAAWPVVHLTTRPGACARFDHPAVYLGAGATPSCPSRVPGTDDVLVLQPAAPGTSAAASTDPTLHQITSSAAGIQATATYAISPSTIELVLLRLWVFPQVN